MFSGVTVSSSLTFLNSATMSLSHQLSLIAAHRPFNVLSVLVASFFFFQRHGMWNRVNADTFIRRVTRHIIGMIFVI